MSQTARNNLIRAAIVIILIDSDFPGFSIPYTLIAAPSPRRAARF